MRFTEYPLKASADRQPLRAIFSPDERYLAVLHRDATPIVYSLTTTKSQKLPASGPVTCVDFRQVVSAANGANISVEVALALPKAGVVRRFNLDRGQTESSIQYHDVVRCVYSMDGSLMATGTSRGKVAIWRVEPENTADRAGFEPIRLVEIDDLPRRSVISMAFNCTNLLLYVVLSSGEVRMIDIKQETDIEVKAEDGSHLDCLAVHTHPQQPSFATFSGFGPMVWMWRTTGTMFHSVDTGLGSYVHEVRVDKDHITAVGQKGVCRISIANRTVSGGWKQKEGMRVIGGLIYHKGFGNVAYQRGQD